MRSCRLKDPDSMNKVMQHPLKAPKGVSRGMHVTGDCQVCGNCTDGAWTDQLPCQAFRLLSSKTRSIDMWKDSRLCHSLQSIARFSQEACRLCGFHQLILYTQRVTRLLKLVRLLTFL